MVSAEHTHSSCEVFFSVFLTPQSNHLCLILVSFCYLYNFPIFSLKWLYHHIWQCFPNNPEKHQDIFQWYLKLQSRDFFFPRHSVIFIICDETSLVISFMISLGSRKPFSEHSSISFKNTSKETSKISTQSALLRFEEIVFSGIGKIVEWSTITAGSSFSWITVGIIL